MTDSPPSCSLQDFFNQAEIPHDVREADFQAWRVRNKQNHAENVKKHTDSGLLASLLAKYDSFNARNGETGIPARVTRSEWEKRLSNAYPEDGAGAKVHAVVSAAASVPSQGLSNGAYWAANHSAELVELTISKSSSLIRIRKVRGPDEYDIGAGRSDKRVSKRSPIREFSRASRRNLQVKAAELKEVVHRPDLMITLTYPGDWRRVCVPECTCGANQGSSDIIFDVDLNDAPLLSLECQCQVSGEIVKNKHLKALRKRMTRFFKKFGVESDSWGALWFFEFQTRGAPHIHILPWGVSAVDLDLFRPYLSRSWADIVAHPDPDEYQKHLNAGTGVEAYREDHFGYALKYAAKMKQKTVPDGWASVGRFWGVWNDPCEAPLTRSFYAVPSSLKKLSDGLSLAVEAYSEAYAQRLRDTFMTVKTFSLRVFGVEASKFLTSYGLPDG